MVIAAGSRYGISGSYMTKMAQIESSWNPIAGSSLSSARGLYQFTSGTAAQYGLTNRLDPVASADAAARLARDNSRALSSSLGRAPTDGELYLAHQQGSGGAAALLNADPNENAIQALRDAGVKDASAHILNNGGTANMTAGQFSDKWTSKLDGSGAKTSPMDYDKAASAKGTMQADDTIVPPGGKVDQTFGGLPNNTNMTAGNIQQIVDGDAIAKAIRDQTKTMSETEKKDTEATIKAAGERTKTWTEAVTSWYNDLKTRSSDYFIRIGFIIAGVAVMWAAFQYLGLGRTITQAIKPAKSI